MYEGIISVMAINDRLSLLKTALRRLAEPRAYGLQAGDGGLGIFVERNHFAAPVLSIATALYTQMAREELIVVSAAQAGQWVISPLGRARLRRAVANDSPFRSQHQKLDMREAKTDTGDTVMVRVNHAESPLAWLFSHTDRQGKSLISLDQFTAGERLRRDFTLASLDPRVTALWGMPINHAGRSGDGGAAAMNDTMIGAKDRVWKALHAVGPDLGGVLLQVCCHLNGLAETEKQLGWPVRSGKVVLGIALSLLAVHYGIQTHRAPKQSGTAVKSDSAYKCHKYKLHYT